MKTKIDIKATTFEEGLIETIDPNVLEIFDEIKLMPDTHVGKAVPIGFVAEYDNKIIPAVVGVDIGCGMAAYTISKREIDFEKLEQFINTNIPSGFNVHDQKQEFDGLNNLSFRIKHARILRSVGTLGGGNHFIEIVEGASDYSIIVHTGSRNLGAQVCDYHQKKLTFDNNKYNQAKVDLIEGLIAEGKEQLIEESLKKIDKNLYGKKWLEGDDLAAYINDMKIAQKYATTNRKAIVSKLVKFFEEDFNENNYFEIPHNYIDFENNIVRKGSISAQDGEMLIIPLNMKDGVVFAKGRGNSEWLYSAPHGAGRKYSRKKAKSILTMDEFKAQMQEVNTFSVCAETLDEAPGAYKNAQQVIEDSQQTMEIIEIKKTIYNFKAKN